jgi:hypothetical protein
MHFHSDLTQKDKRGREEAFMHSPAVSRIEETILQALKDLRFGSVEIIVHDSKVVQIERREKVRVERLSDD